MVSVPDIDNFEVLIATAEFGFDPFEESKRQKLLAKAPESSSGSVKRVLISILGQPGVGKSALALRFCKSDFVSYYSPTIEDE